MPFVRHEFRNNWLQAPQLDPYREATIHPVISIPRLYGPHALHDLHSVSELAGRFQATLHCPISKTIRLRRCGINEERDNGLEKGLYHHFDTPLADSVNNFLSLSSVCNFQLLLKEDGSLLVG
jgi:hypothetical protein